MTSAKQTKSSKSSPAAAAGTKRTTRPAQPAPVQALTLSQMALEPVPTKGRSKKRGPTYLEVILHQVWHKAMEGNAHARRLCVDYWGLAPDSVDNRPQIVFVDNDYMRSFATFQAGRTDER